MKMPWQATGTAGKRDAALTALAAAEAKLTDLESQRVAALGNDDITAARALDRQIVEARQEVATFTDRLELLRAKIQREESEKRTSDYMAAVAHIEANLLPPRAAAAVELEAALKAVAVAARNLQETSNAVRQGWPAGMPRLSEYGVSCLALDRLGARAKDCFQPGLLVRKYTLTSAQRHEFTEQILRADQRADGFAAAEVEQHANLLSELRSHSVPEIEPIDEEAA
jgi:hypothetical protein